MEVVCLSSCRGGVVVEVGSSGSDSESESEEGVVDRRER